MEPIKIELKNVLMRDESGNPTDEKNLTVEVMPFSRRNDAHTRYAYDFADMMNGIKSTYADLVDAAKGYVDIFLCRQSDMAEQMEVYNAVRADIRAARTLLMHPNVQDAIQAFFTNA